MESPFLLVMPMYLFGKSKCRRIMGRNNDNKSGANLQQVGSTFMRGI
ncbi:Hypothetical protein Cul05146_0765 [Corynebacterium ulcerans]|uniref:Uncharacterized protein n=1 Tax=Corynebacterium ulcerans FRC58 TaxID=1408268 RepID=A0ABN4GT09_CORUL|nr:Hypothetical protein Cul05146_0765 [Corynebacterium ulcerans]AKN76636.1 Hypothetical protein CulFRC58_0782 [Corynebacterium ulcerans FRC58]